MELKLAVEDIQKIVNVLAKQPYEEVYILIGEIQAQANEQIK